MTKKTVREQNKIILLADKNQQELDSIEAERAKKEVDFDRLKKGTHVASAAAIVPAQSPAQPHGCGLVS